MNGLFFGNIAQSSGVDPRYPVIIPDYIGVEYNSTIYINNKYFVSDDITKYNKIHWNYPKNIQDITIGFSLQMWNFTNKNSENEYVLCHFTATDQDGFTTEKDIPLICQNSYNTKSIEIDEVSTYSIDLIELFSDTEQLLDFDYSSAKCYTMDINNQCNPEKIPAYIPQINDSFLVINQIEPIYGNSIKFVIFVIDKNKRVMSIDFKINKLNV